LVADYNWENSGIKLNIYQDEITEFSDINIGLGYNWGAHIGKKSRFSLGVRADYGIYSATLGNVATGIENDPAFNSISSNYINLGGGLYWHSENVFTGLSAPYLFNNSRDAGLINFSNMDILFNHFFYTFGARFGNRTWQFIPSTLVTFVSGSPISFDLNANWIYDRTILFGLGYRNNNTAILSGGFIVLKDLKFVYSYDITAFGISGGGGSHEITAGYGVSFFDGKFSKKRRYLKKNYQRKKNPRYY